MKDLFRYDGKRALVVGCASGMGAATVDVVQSLGGEVHGVDYGEPAAQLAGFTRVDLRDGSQVDALLESLDGPFHSVFYCAGLAQTHPPRDVMAVNFAAMRAVVEGVLAKVPSGGAIAIIASTGGLGFANHMEEIRDLLATESYDGALAWVDEHADLVADGYVFSKEVTTVYAMRRSFDAIGQGVRINCLSPSGTATPMMSEFEKATSPEIMSIMRGPVGRQAEPEEMAWPLAFLNSEAANYVVGLNLVVDGGFLAGTTTGAIDMNERIGRIMELMASERS
jgi:NAD(P)-dependent dehydrogenase (short-subunit alcohol dehydrogenase family)